MVKVNNKVIVVPRLELLYMTIVEYLRAFGAEESTIKCVEKGVLDKEIIKRIDLHYFSGKKYCGKVSLTINWEKHKVHVSDDTGDEYCFQEDEGSLLEQLDEASRIIIAHVNKLRRDLNINRIEARYTYIPKYEDDKEMHKKAMDYLGHVTKDPIKDSANKEFSTKIKYIMDKLDELEINVEY